MRTFSESLRFPAPDAPVEVVLKKRDAKNQWIDIWTTPIDPKDIFIDRSKPRAPGRLIPIQNMGESSAKVDFLILGDGYTARELKKFEADARRLTKTLFATSPFKEHRRHFNVWALCPPATESGISRPSTGIYRDSPVGATYDAFGSERYVLTFNIKPLHRSPNSRLMNSSRYSPTIALTAVVEFSISTHSGRRQRFADYVFVTSLDTTSLHWQTSIHLTRRLCSGSRYRSRRTMGTKRHALRGNPLNRHLGNSGDLRVLLNGKIWYCQTRHSDAME